MVRQHRKSLGMIEDKILLAQIVRIYGLIKVLIDNLNASWGDYQRWRQGLLQVV